MDITLLGVRGSLPSPSQNTSFYGANTPSVELRTTGDDLLVFDAGSGIRFLEDALAECGECHLFITHGHSDHTQGLGFFKPLFKPGWTVHVYLPCFYEDLLDEFFDGRIFPVRREALKAKVETHIIRAGQLLELPTKSKVIVTTLETDHPGGNMAYKVTADGVTFLYLGDHEITPGCGDAAKHAATYLDDVDIALVDTHFSREDFMPGWGHSAWQDWVEVAESANLKTLILSHHSPERTDGELDTLQKRFMDNSLSGTTVCVGREGMRFCPDMDVLPDIYTSEWLPEFIEKIGRYKEESVILDTILKKTREITRADAGTVFLYDGNELVFSYTHNDSLFPANESSKYAYANFRLPCTEDSIAGYTAVMRKSLSIPNVRELPPDAPYGFNDSFDKTTGYRTISTLTIPLVGKNLRLMGVLQLINSLDPRSGKPRPFTSQMEKTVRVLAMEASKVLEVSSTITDNIYRLLHIAALHDPSETGPHAERVGAVAAEIYREWAKRHGVPLDEAQTFRSQLRLAAMVHDIGKVGISDSILKKAGRLSAEEYEIIKTHAEKGAELFDAEHQDISELAHGIVLHHHQHWDGNGYGPTGKEPLKGEDIPLAARITAVADVFDALVSSRCYKEAWEFERAVDLLRKESGKHFDPELIGCFMSILDTIFMIYRRFPDSLTFSFPAYRTPGVK